MRFLNRLLVLPLAAMLLGVFALSGCGSSSNAGSTPKTITVASKLDSDSQLEAEMYVLLLQKHGYTVTSKLALGDTSLLKNAITSGQVDLYPEFTGTGLSVLGLKGTADPNTAYSEAKSGYETQFHITWLDQAINLNDSYALCTSQANATKYSLSKISDVTPIASKLVLTAQQDAVSSPDVVPAMLSAYNLTFKSTVQLMESLSFAAVTSGQADVNICYTTDPNIITNNFVILTDDKVVFPAYNPAPIIRDSVLAKYPDIASILNPLQAKLTTANIDAAIKSFGIDKQPVDVVAMNFLQAQGLI